MPRAESISLPKDRRMAPAATRATDTICARGWGGCGGGGGGRGKGGRDESESVGCLVSWQVVWLVGFSVGWLVT